MAAVDVIDAYIEALPGATRRLAHGEWGLTVPAEEAAGWPLDVGIRLAEGVLGAQAQALDSSEGIDPWMLLWWNRQTRYVRFACTRGADPKDSPPLPDPSREVWVHGELAVAAVDEREVDRLLGLVVEGAITVREFQAAARLAPKEPDPAGASWLAGSD